MCSDALTPRACNCWANACTRSTRVLHSSASQAGAVSAGLVSAPRTPIQKGIWLNAVASKGLASHLLQVGHAEREIEWRVRGILVFGQGVAARGEEGHRGHFPRIEQAEAVGHLSAREKPYTSSPGCRPGSDTCERKVASSACTRGRFSSAPAALAPGPGNPGRP